MSFPLVGAATGAPADVGTADTVDVADTDTADRADGADTGIRRGRGAE
ncbi:hypothetical protein ACLQ2R_34480 [Streptosporangium sp. DT93]